MSALDVFWQRCEGPIVYGVNDCCMVLADVIVASAGPDLMASYRGRYKTQLGFMRVFRKAGHLSLDAAATAEFERYGQLVSAPQDFDVAVVSYADGSKRLTSPAFFHSGFWCLRSERGGLVLDHATFNGEPKIFRVI